MSHDADGGLPLLNQHKSLRKDNVANWLHGAEWMMRRRKRL